MGLGLSRGAQGLPWGQQQDQDPLAWAAANPGRGPLVATK